MNSPDWVVWVEMGKVPGNGPGPGQWVWISGYLCLCFPSPDTTQTVPEDNAKDLTPPLELCIRTK